MGGKEMKQNKVNEKLVKETVQLFKEAMGGERKTYQPIDATRAADNVMAEKDSRYRERWREYRLVSLIDIALSKIRRVDTDITEFEDWEDALEETIDAINYLRYLWCKIAEKAGQR